MRRRKSSTLPKSARRQSMRSVDSLSNHEVQHVRKLYSDGYASLEEIASIYHILPAMVLMVAKGLARAEVPQ